MTLKKKLWTEVPQLPVPSKLYQSKGSNKVQLTVALKNNTDQGFMHRINSNRYVLPKALLFFVGVRVILPPKSIHSYLLPSPTVVVCSSKI